jgi:hypothetical protein
MKHLFFVLGLSLIGTTIIQAQDTAAFPNAISIKPTVYINKNINIDTVVSPEYYSMDVTLAEYKMWTGRGRNSRSTLVDMDSLEVKLSEILDSLNIETPVTKTGLSVNSNAYYVKKNHLLQATYKLQIQTREEVEALFKMLNEILPTNCFRGCYAHPYLSSFRQEELKRAMGKKAELILMKEMELYAKKKGLEITTSTPSTTSIYQKSFGQNYQNVYYQTTLNQGFKLNLEHPTYTLMVGMNYTLQAK